MRIALDLQACQTESRHRGIGRYSADFARALLEFDRAQYVVGLDATYPAAQSTLMQGLADVVPPAAFTHYHYPGPNRPHGHAEDSLRPAARALVRHHYARLAPDVVHVSSLFEGFVEHAACLGGVAGLPGAISSVTLYDLIPLVYREHYLGEPTYRRWYEDKLRRLQRFDMLLSLSEASSRDAVSLLGVDADRIHVIGGGVDPAFRPKRWPDAERRAFLHRLGIAGRFVLYTGNSDARKNLEGAVRAFAAVPAELRQGLQLVLNQVDDQAGVRALARQSGLQPNAVVITGRVDDADLVGLLQNCALFFFPSLYEGFGLPVLEAMACGAAVIAGDNSSIPEVVGCKDALFDASSVEATTDALARVLGDDGFRHSLAADNPARARPHTWQKVASRALDAWETARRRKASAPSVAVPARRPRIAMVTPLPPERTGIADYMAGFAPALAAECDVDYFTSHADALAPSVCSQVFSWQELPARVHAYDHVVYQFGNSPFHSHMVDLLDACPGTVVLHDFYLSSMFWHMDRHEGRPGLFAEELERSHGRKALQVLGGEHGAMEARRTYPASRRILERAIAVVVHSTEAAELPGRHFPGLKRLRMRTLPMPIPTNASADAHDRRNRARLALGIDEGDFLCVSMGFIADTKLSHLLVEAAALVPAGARLRVALVGANDGGAYGSALSALITKLERQASVVVTGFVDAATFDDYLDAADCAVQLRTMSRGESSKTVLDCMARGIPTIVNDYGAFAELPAEVVSKLPAQPAPVELAAALVAFRQDDGRRIQLGRRARAYIQQVHAPRRVAAQFAALVQEAAAFSPAAADLELANGLVGALTGRPGQDVALDALQCALASNLRPLREPRLYVDLSEVVRVDHRTGIHRVVRNIARELMLAEQPTLQRVVPVAHADSRIEQVESFTSTQLGVPASVLPEPIDFALGDTLLLLDSAWDCCERFLPTIERIHAAGGRVGAMVYDLIPLRFPQYCVDYMPAVFERWLTFVVQHCDFIVCISKAVADDLRAWIGEAARGHRPGLVIGHVHLGADVDERKGQDASPSAAALRAMDGSQSLLMVGTIEPRKRYDLALDAFELARKSGSPLKLVLVGKQGWNVEAIVARIKSHPLYGQRLFWLDTASDQDLEHCYRNARCLVQTSDAEGFGLPIVEAARHGTPLLLSDIPVFREIAGEQASYFTAGSATGLGEALLREDFSRGHPGALGISWGESARRLDALLVGGGWDHVVD